MRVDNRISTRIFAQGLLIVLCFSLVLAWIYPKIKRNLFEGKKQGSRQVVELACQTAAMFAGHARSGALSPAEARDRAVAAIRALRYNGNDYFWIHDLEPRMVMHPIKPELEGKPLSDYADPGGNKPFRAAADICRKGGAGYVDYLWPRPGASEAVHKISYVKLFPDWGWVIGSGVYVDDVDKELNRFLLAGFGGAGVILAACLALSWWMGRSITDGISRLVTNTRAMAGGELRTRIPEEGFYELRELARAFNAMSDHLQERVLRVMGRIRDTGMRIDGLSAQILMWIQNVSGAARQSASVSDLTSTMEELSRSSRQIWSNAESVKDAATQTVEMAQQGTVLVRESVDTIARMQARVSDIVQKNLFLAEKSHEIGKVLDIIRDVARETHMLALNAALEASIAGEHGRRFAAVATEVRRLSDKTRQSIDAVSSVILQIRTAIDSSVKASEQGIRDAERSREAINLSADAFTEIIQMIEKTSDASARISASTHHQSSANEQVVQSMRQVSDTIRSISAHVQEFAAAAAELKAAMEKLQDSGSLFQV